MVADHSRIICDLGLITVVDDNIDARVTTKYFSGFISVREILHFFYSANPQAIV